MEADYMNKFYKLIGIITSIAVIVCILTACSFFEEKVEAVIFSLDKKENYSFTITVEGAKWENFTYDAYRAGFLVDFPDFTINVVDEQNQKYWYSFYAAFPVTNWKRTSDTVVTATFVNGYTLTGRMEIEFTYPEALSFYDRASELIIGGEFSDRYKVNPAKSSIVWE
jgi:hypothetical protein